MIHGMYSLKGRYAFGSAAIGLCLIALGVARIFDKGSLLALAAAASLLLVSALSLFASLSPRREASDEMSEAHDGQAAGHTLRATLIVMSLICTASIATNAKVDLASAGLGVIGFGLLTYGIVFGWLER